MREQVYNQSQLHQERMKNKFDKHSKQEEFHLGDLVLKWDARNEDKGKNGKFDNIWMGPFKISAYHENNSYFLEELNGECVGWGPINARFLKHYLMQQNTFKSHVIVNIHFVFVSSQYVNRKLKP
jgi:hypothetical protein